MDPKCIKNALALDNNPNIKISRNEWKALENKIIFWVNYERFNCNNSGVRIQAQQGWCFIDDSPDAETSGL
jgi:hypothetical protein